MSEACSNDNTTSALETMSTAADIPALEAGITSVADLLREVRIINSWAILGEADPAKALDQLEKAAEVHWAAPPLLPALHDALVALMQCRIAADAAERVCFEGVSLTRMEIDRCEAFKRDPGAYVPGAVHAAGLAAIGPASVDGFLDVDGEVCPWVYSAVGVGKSGIWELAMTMSELGFSKGIIVGTHLREGAVVPDSITFIKVR